MFSSLNIRKTEVAYEVANMPCRGNLKCFPSDSNSSGSNQWVLYSTLLYPQQRVSLRALDSGLFCNTIRGISQALPPEVHIYSKCSLSGFSSVYVWVSECVCKVRERVFETRWARGWSVCFVVIVWAEVMHFWVVKDWEHVYLCAFWLNAVNLSFGTMALLFEKTIDCCLTSAASSITVSMGVSLICLIVISISIF